MQISTNLNKLLFYLAVGVLLLALAPFSASWVEGWMSVPALNIDQAWRFFTAHFSHWSWAHWWTNCAAFVCFLLLYFHTLSARNILVFTGFLLIGNGVFLSFFYTREFYLGFSGLLYAWFVYGALWKFSERGLLNGLVLLFLLLRALGVGRELAGADELAVASEIHWLNMVLALAALGLHRLFFWFFVKRFL